ncbi:MAG: hypothetical protein ABIP75_09850 [Pyrinomonadaceae bacterium]
MSDKPKTQMLKGQMAALVSESYEEALAKAEALYASDPTEAHFENLKEARRDCNWQQGQINRGRKEFRGGAAA